ncbi:MAG: CrcB family protein [Chloroflexota bacterium]|nr:CrcB family protein [Chloroflexota bacterium]
MNWLLVALGGSVGALCRYGVDRAAASILGTTVLGTFVVNVTGSLILGILLGTAAVKSNWPPAYSLFLTVGFCGSFTTFSTITVASAGIIEEGDYIRAILNIGGSILIGLLAAFTGLWIGRNAF